MFYLQRRSLFYQRDVSGNDLFICPVSGSRFSFFCCHSSQALHVLISGYISSVILSVEMINDTFCKNLSLFACICLLNLVSQ